jgi:hypothetical protein
VLPRLKHGHYGTVHSAAKALRTCANSFGDTAAPATLPTPFQALGTLQIANPHRIRTTRRQEPFGFGKSRDLCLGSHPEAMWPASVGPFQLGYMQCVKEVEASAPGAMWNFRLQCTLASVETRTWNEPWEDTQMRLSLICSIMAVLALVALAPSSATAETGNMTGRYHYAACSCQFGYPGRACVPAVACGAEGGRCSGTCVPQPPEPVSE